MKIEYIETHARIGKIAFETKELPKKVGLVSTVQLKDDLQKVADFLKTKKIEAKIAGAVLGCDQSIAKKIEKDVDAFLYIGSGDFHPVGVAAKTNKEVFVWRPGAKKLEKVDAKKIEEIERKKKGMLTKFISAQRIGVIMTTKAGQANIQAGFETIMWLEKKYQDKKFYYFFVETLNPNELENFPFVQCWINTMCPRIREDLNILNIEDLIAFEKTTSKKSSS
jgi:2-(3-amino-3-carboxypropyl)histidine synthase